MGKLKGLSILKRPRVFIPVIVVLLILIAVFLAVRNLNAPAEGTISQTPPEKAETIDPYANPGNYSGKYLSFTYPAHYKQIPSQITGSYLEVVGFYSTDQTSKQISVGVLKESLSDDSSVSYRRQNPSLYHESPRTESGVVIFTKTSQGSEQTAFVPHLDKVASISITAPFGWDLTGDMETILNSLHWKQ